MLIMYNKKVEVKFSKEDMDILDGQSRILNWLYNQMLSLCIEDYKEHNNSKKLLQSRNMRDYVTNVMKVEYPFLKTVHSSPVKEVSARLKDSFGRLFTGQNKYPKFRSWKRSWYSLFFDEPNKGWEMNGNDLIVMLGKIPGMAKLKGKHNPGVTGKLVEEIVLGEDEKINTFRLKKERGDRFYAVFTIERGGIQFTHQKEAKKKYQEENKQYNFLKKQAKTKEEKALLPPKPIKPNFEPPLPKEPKWIALDPNHKNFFVGVDYKGNSIEWEKLGLIKYWDKKIDELKSKRDKCEKMYRKRTTEHGNKYTVHSPRWNRLNDALNRAYDRRREQIKVMKFTIAHELFKRYDVVIIGDYTPTNGTAPFKNMKRSMLNQEIIGQFRKTLKWVAEKTGKQAIVAGEYNTTKDCCVCGNQEKKDPSVRQFKCESCKTTMMRDSNAAVNIAKKKGFDLELKQKKKLAKFTHKGHVPIGKKAIIEKQ